MAKNRRGQQVFPQKQGMVQAVEAMPPVVATRDGRRVTLSKQEALAHRLGVSQQAISSWARRGWAPLKRCDEISQITGVPARDLMDPRVRKMAEQVAAA
jgi:transcriptional regulator with XRE-family HTH domain